MINIVALRFTCWFCVWDMYWFDECCRRNLTVRNLTAVHSCFFCHDLWCTLKQSGTVRLELSEQRLPLYSFQVFSSCLAIISAVMVGGLFLWPALRYGTGYQTVWEIRPSAETPSSVHWRHFYIQFTHIHSTLELSGRCCLQTYLLTVHSFSKDTSLHTWLIVHRISGASDSSLTCWWTTVPL